MAGRYKPQINHNSEFDLDLAPLLAVMVKLVPVLLVSSAFVQLMIVETELPQVVQQAISQQEKQVKKTIITLQFGKRDGVRIIASVDGNEKVSTVNMAQDKNFDFEAIHSQLVELKKIHPEVFKIEFSPASDVAYKDVVRMMDEVRKVRGGQLRFPIKDTKTGAMTNTDYMFPEVVFANMSEG